MVSAATDIAALVSFCISLSKDMRSATAGTDDTGFAVGAIVG